MTNPFVKTVVEGAKRENTKPVVKKMPISNDILMACCEKYATCNELPIRRDISIALLFAGFFRFSELAGLTMLRVRCFKVVGSLLSNQNTGMSENTTRIFMAVQCL